MKKKYVIIAGLVAFWTVVPALGAHILFGQSPVAHQIRPTKTHEMYSSTGQGSIGGEREQAVLAATRRYVAENPDATEAMRDGRELAPVDVLNADLAERHAKFRVRSVKGMKAQFYDVMG